MDVYGVIGDPVDHSRSPAMFNAAFDARGIDAVYGAFRVDTGALGTAVEGALALGVAGLNVTGPHKSAVLDHAASTDLVGRVGAANVLDLRTSPPTAHNTDAGGMAAVVDAEAPEPDDALLLGAGGAGRAYAHALADRGWSVTVANRTVERAEAVVDAVGGDAAIPLGAATEVVPEVALVVNATPIGLGDPEETPVPGAAFRDSHVVIDAVYDPVRTRLLRDASADGATTVTGLRLLLEQADGTYRIWRDGPAPRAAMRSALRR